MPTKPRAKRTEVVVPKPVVRERPTKFTLYALRPVCGKTLTDRAVKLGGVTVGKTPYFETIEWDKNKPFGVAIATGGRGSFTEWHHISEKDAPELFEGLKGRLLQALQEWLDKGWIERAEVKELVG